MRIQRARNIAAALRRIAATPPDPWPSSASPAQEPDIPALAEALPRPDTHELVFVADLTVEVRAWPHGSWAEAGVDRRRPPAR